MLSRTSSISSTRGGVWSSATSSSVIFTPFEELNNSRLRHRVLRLEYRRQVSPRSLVYSLHTRRHNRSASLSDLDVAKIKYAPAAVRSKILYTTAAVVRVVRYLVLGHIIILVSLVETLFRISVFECLFSNLCSRIYLSSSMSTHKYIDYIVYTFNLHHLWPMYLSVYRVGCEFRVSPRESL